MKKKALGILLGTTLAVGLAACGGGDKDAGSGNGETASANDPETIVKQSCIQCHGDNLEGRNGPALANIGAELSKDEILDVIVNGRPGMPGNIIKGDDADKVAAWLAEKK